MSQVIPIGARPRRCSHCGRPVRSPLVLPARETLTCADCALLWAHDVLAPYGGKPNVTLAEVDAAYAIARHALEILRDGRWKMFSGVRRGRGDDLSGPLL